MEELYENFKSIECWRVTLQLVKVKELDVSGSLVLSQLPIQIKLFTYVCIRRYFYIHHNNGVCEYSHKLISSYTYLSR